jgi:hypothetical protein
MALNPKDIPYILKMEYVDIICNSKVVKGYIVTSNKDLIKELLVQLYAFRGGFVPTQMTSLVCASQNRCYSMVTHLILRILIGRNLQIDYDTCGCSNHHAIKHINEIKTILEDYMPSRMKTIRKCIDDFLWTKPYKGHRNYKSNVQHIVGGNYKQIKLRLVRREVFQEIPNYQLTSKYITAARPISNRCSSVVKDVVMCLIDNGCNSVVKDVAMCSIGYNSVVRNNIAAYPISNKCGSVVGLVVGFEYRFMVNK